MKNSIQSHLIAEAREKARPCFQCGICAASCPVFRVSPEFNPRIAIDALVRTGQIGKSGKEWSCAFCLMCEQRCPMGVTLAEILIQLKNISAITGTAPKEAVEGLQAVLKTGFLVQPSKRTERLRTELELPELPKPTEKELTKLVKTMNVLSTVLHENAMEEKQK